MSLNRMQDKITRYVQQHIERGIELKSDVVASFILTADSTRSDRACLLRWLEITYPPLWEELQEVCPRLFIPRDVVISYTTAPSVYDGFGTEELAVVGTLNGKPLRKIETPGEHVQWQRGRNGSGMHPSYDEAEFLELLDRPWYVALTPEEPHA